MSLITKLAPAKISFSPSMRQKIDVADLYRDALRRMPEMIDGLPPLPVPNVCPVTLDELLADHLADLCGVVVTRDLAEHLMIWAGERFAGLEGRLDRVIVLLERISGA